MAWGPTAQAELLHCALEELGMERPVIDGHSWGTMVAVALDLARSQYDADLVLLSGFYYPAPCLDAALLPSPALSLVGDLMRYALSTLINRLIWPAMARKLFGSTEIPIRFENEYPV